MGGHQDDMDRCGPGIGFEPAAHLPPVRADANQLAQVITNLIANALRGCRDQLIRTDEGDRAVILISDGGSGDFQNGGDREVAELLALGQVGERVKPW